MIKIAIVDDEQQERDTLKGFFGQLSKELHEEMDMKLFSSGEQFLSCYEKEYDLICLDIDMEGRDGIETAKEIRKADGDVLIIFITNMAQMAIRGYEVHALDFILKPVNYYSFAMKIQTAVTMINSQKSRNIVLPTANGMIRFSTNSLYYAEVDGHYIFYHTASGTYKQKASMKELEERLDTLSFKRCNNCYLVNLKYVDGVEKDEVRINGESLKISRPRKKEFMQALANYMGGIAL
ncbi:MAG: LytTR family DNA-binding domain-containing protein [Lachnospiraceae bacterium]|nr:LytTR family DNA-binding domain-containing protein [Lachnospiraceae bacterium]